MKQILFFLLGLIISSIEVFSQAKTLKVFNTQLKIKDIIGTTNLHTQEIYYDLPEVLVRNEDYYLNTIGSYRNFLQSTDPNILFNLVDKGNYPLLDKINMRYYDEIAIPSLKSDTSINKRTDFKEFCREWEKVTDPIERKGLLFRDDFITIGKAVQLKRFSITKTNFNFTKEATTKLSASIKAEIAAELKARQIEVKSSVVSYLSRVVNSRTSYAAVLMVVEFDDRYMSRLKNTLNGINSKELGDDDFSKGLIDYGSVNSQKVVTSGLLVFQLNGTIDKSTLTESDIKADISSKFPKLDAASIASTISLSIVKKVSKRFDAEINNIYIRSLLTSKKIDVITVLNKIESFKDAPVFETVWQETDLNGVPYSESFDVTSQPCNHCGGIFWQKEFKLTSHPNGRIKCVKYRCLDGPCGWSYNPDNNFHPTLCDGEDNRDSYRINYSIVDEQQRNSFIARRKWDSNVVKERYTAYYSIPVRVCVKNCD